MRVVRTIFFVLALILLLTNGRTALINDDFSAIASDSDSSLIQATKTSFSLSDFLKSKQTQNQENKTVDTSQFKNQTGENSQNITMNYEQYLKLYKPEKLKKLNEFKNEKQHSQYLLDRSTYETNIRYINNFNRDPTKTYKMGINSYTDVDPIKFEQLFKVNINQDALILKNRPLDRPQVSQSTLNFGFASSISQITSRPIALRPPQKKADLNITVDELRSVNLIYRLSEGLYTMPDQVTLDWRNISGRVNFQGRCNACYVFSVTDALYTTLRIQKITAQPFSAQQIISCIKDPHEQKIQKSNGCIEGVPQQVYYYIQTQGVGLERDYPFSNNTILNFNDSGVCNKKLLQKPEYLKNKYKLFNYNPVQVAGDCHLVASLLKNSSLTGVLAGETFQFQHYKSGVYTNIQKITQISQLNHAVAIVGYDHVKRAFIIKNSWDTSWGQDGFGYVHLNTGICISVYYPILK